MIGFKEYALQRENISEVFGLFKKMQMNRQMSRGAKKIASEVVLEKIIKPALKNFKDAFEDINIEEKKGKGYLFSGYEFVIHLNLSDKYITRYKDSNFANSDFVRKVESEVKSSYNKWKQENKDDIYSQMITKPMIRSTYEGNVKNSKGEYEQNIAIQFRILDGNVNLPK